MFIQEDLLYEKLKCNICNKLLKDPVSLPCMEFVCKICITDYIEENSENNKKPRRFKCFSCDQIHVAPREGFPKSKMVDEILEIQSKNVNKGSFVEKFKAELNECMNEINQIKTSLDDREEIVKDYFELKRQQIYQVTDSKIDNINMRSKELLDKIDTLEKQNLDNLKNKRALKKIEDDLKKATEFCGKWIEKLKMPETSEEDVRKERTEFDHLLRSVKANSCAKNGYIFNSQQIDFYENHDEVKSSFLGQLELGCIKEGIVTVKPLTKMPVNLQLENNFLIDLSQFSNGNLCATSFSSYNHYKRNGNSNSSNYPLNFSILDSAEAKHQSFMSSNNFSAQYIENRSVQSMSNGTHVLISLHFADHNNSQYVYLISSDTPSKYEKVIATSKECNISMDSKQAYIMNPTSVAIDIYNFMLKSIRSIQVNQNLSHLFDPKATLKISNDLLYSLNANKIDIHQLLFNMKLIKSINITIDCTPITKCFLNNYLIFISNDYISYFNIKNGKTYKRSIYNREISDDSNLQIRVLDENKLCFFNADANKYFISS